MNHRMLNGNVRFTNDITVQLVTGFESVFISQSCKCSLRRAHPMYVNAIANQVLRDVSKIILYHKNGLIVHRIIMRSDGSTNINCPGLKTEFVL